MGILKAAKHYGGSSLKRFILLGSAVSVLNSFEDLTKEGRPYTEKDWNPVTMPESTPDGIFLNTTPGHSRASNPAE